MGHKGKVSLQDDQSGSRDFLPGDKVILLNDMADDGDYRSPRRSPRTRQVHRTYSTPNPSHSMNITEVVTPGHRGRGAVDIECSPMSTGFSPTLVDNQKKIRKPSP